MLFMWQPYRKQWEYVKACGRFTYSEYKRKHPTLCFAWDKSVRILGHEV